jgi:hypothetical protein
MERKTKYTVALLATILALGCILWAPSALAGNGHRVKVDEDQEGGYKISNFNWGKYKPKTQLGLFLGNGTLETLKGEAMAIDGKILIVEVNGGDYVNIVVPGRWIVGQETMDVKELFGEDGPLDYGVTLTISLLKYEISRQTHTVTFLYAYKIVQDLTTAGAILPFNIRATS